MVQGFAGCVKNDCVKMTNYINYTIKQSVGQISFKYENLKMCNNVHTREQTGEQNGSRYFA